MLKGLGLDYSSVKEDGRVRISTIHGAKGAEADNVVLLGNMSRATRLFMDEAVGGTDAELRVFYTGITRTKNRLWLVDGGFRGFDLW
jgi:superfamily I DNA/RNA helicase